jgi:hypothetical protein
LLHKRTKELHMKHKPYFYFLFFFLPAALLLLFTVAGGLIVLRLSRATPGATLAALASSDLDHTNTRRQAPVNMDCTLIVPANPLSAQGLATPYQLVATNAQNGPCNESNKMQAAFVQGAIINPATGTISIYNPLVVDQGTQPAIAPQPPFGGQIPAGDVVGLWFGSNANTLTLQGTDGSLAQGQCVNGADGSIFGQFAYCNTPAFFQAAQAAMQAGKLNPPSLGMGKDGMMCPSTRDFSIVDQDQSDNVTTTYLVTAGGQIAQNTAANAATLGSQVQANGSDERLLTLVDKALGCTPWLAPDLADAGHLVPALPLNELQAGTWQGTPVGLVPNADPMVLTNNSPDLAKLNAYRAGVDQPLVQDAHASSTRTYCQHLLDIAPARLQADEPLTRAAPPADPAVANSLFTFLAQRFVTTYGAPSPGLNCQARTGVADPITVQTDGNGVATGATISVQGMSSPMNTGPDCVINGNPLPGCTGTATINGQTCSFAFDQNTRKITVACPASQ